MKNKTKYYLFITLLVFIGLIVAVGLLVSFGFTFNDLKMKGWRLTGKKKKRTLFIN